MKYRIISLVLTLLMLAAVVPFTATPALAASSYNFVEVIPLKYDKAYSFSEGLAAVKLDGKWGFIDVNDNVVIPFMYDDVMVFKEGWAGVMINGKWGFIDKTGMEVIPLQYDRVMLFFEGMAAILVDEKWGFIDINGNEIVPPKYQYQPSVYQGGLTRIMYSPAGTGIYGFLDKAGNEVIPPEYSGVAASYGNSVQEGVVGLKRETDGKWGYLDIVGNEVIPFQYDGARPFSEGVAGVKRGEKWGFIDKDCTVVIPFQYDDVSSFHEGLAAVQIGGAWGYIDKSGTIIIQPKYGTAWEFEDGFASVALGPKRGIIDKTGAEVIAPRDYAYIYFAPGEDLAKVCTGSYGAWDKSGVVDRTGNIVVPVGMYDIIQTDSTEGLWCVGRYNTRPDGSTDYYNAQYGYIAIVEVPDAPNLSTASGWAREGITSAVAKGFVPKDLQNNYTNVITRAEFCRMAVNYVEYATGKSIDTILAEKGLTRDPSAFADTSDPDILAAFALGITNGTGDKQFTPDGQFSREQAATMIMNTCKVLGIGTTGTDAGFSDAGSISSWAVDGVNFVRVNGIMNGTGNDNFSPQGTYTRQESIVTFDRIG